MSAAMNDLFAALALPIQRSAPIPEFDPDVSTLRCCVCGSLDYIRIKPGQSATATHISPNSMTDNVMILPGVEIPTVAWCRSCDPLIRSMPDVLSPADAEFLSWATGTTP